MIILSKRPWIALVAGLLVLCSCLVSCTPFNEKEDSWIGLPMERWLAIPNAHKMIEEIRGPDEQGNKIYVIRIEKKCVLFRTVDANGIITGWKSEGSACKHYWN